MAERVPPKVHIVSDGRSDGTRITVDGHPIEELVDRITWTVDSLGLGRATVEFYYVSVDVIGEQVTP